MIRIHVFLVNTYFDILFMYIGYTEVVYIVTLFGCMLLIFLEGSIIVYASIFIIIFYYD